MTGLPEASSPTARRLELGVLLRALRNDKGWTVEQVSERLLCSPSKVSRLETGRRGASPRDIRDLCDLYEVDEAQRQRLTNLAAEGKQQAGWQTRGLTDSTSRYVGLESAAASISDFGLGLIPGLLQTSEYALAVLRTIQPPLSSEQIEQRLASRMDRRALLTSQQGPAFEAVLDESVLHRVAGSRATMYAQLAQLADMSDLPRVTIRVVPYLAGLLPVPNNKFIVLTFERPALPSQVFVEALTGDQYLDSADDVAAYEGAFSVLRGMSLSAAESRAIIGSVAIHFRDC